MMQTSQPAVAGLASIRESRGQSLQHQALQQLLALRNLVIDEPTSLDGTCGINAFTANILAKSKREKHPEQKCTSAEERRLLSLRRCPLVQRVPQARAAAIPWLGEHPRAKLWEGMTMSKLVGHKSGEDLPTYVHKMGWNSNLWTRCCCMPWLVPMGLLCCYSKMGVVQPLLALTCMKRSTKTVLWWTW